MRLTALFEQEKLRPFDEGREGWLKFGQERSLVQMVKVKVVQVVKPGAGGQSEGDADGKVIFSLRMESKWVERRWRPGSMLIIVDGRIQNFVWLLPNVAICPSSSEEQCSGYGVIASLP